MHLSAVTCSPGDAWEAQARRWLEGKGLRFIAANVNERGGEIDLIMREGRTTVFIEVRYRRSALYGGAAASVTRSKQHKLLQTARLWLARHNGSFDTVDCRFDVVAFTAEGLAYGVSLPWQGGMLILGGEKKDGKAVSDVIYLKKNDKQIKIVK